METVLSFLMNQSLSITIWKSYSCGTCMLTCRLHTVYDGRINRKSLKRAHSHRQHIPSTTAQVVGKRKTQIENYSTPQSQLLTIIMHVHVYLAA